MTPLAAILIVPSTEFVLKWLRETWGFRSVDYSP
jgi:hypothetical protein